MPEKRAKSFLRRCNDILGSMSDEMGNLLVNIFHHLALFAIGAATVWASVYAFWGMTEKSHAGIEDLLLLFIYLEIGAMVGIYFKTNRMPVRFLIYVAITALTRLLISIVNHHENIDGLNIVMVAGAILILAIAALILRYGSYKFPSASNATPLDPSLDDDS